MKNCFFFLFLSFLCVSNLEAQTYANVPGPENVLVVYKLPVDQSDSIGLVSQAIKNYYRDARNIPNSNIVPLYLPDTTMNINNEIRTINIAEGGNIIRDSLGHL